MIERWLIRRRDTAAERWFEAGGWVESDGWRNRRRLIALVAWDAAVMRLAARSRR